MPSWLAQTAFTSVKQRSVIATVLGKGPSCAHTPCPTCRATLAPRPHPAHTPPTPRPHRSHIRPAPLPQGLVSNAGLVAGVGLALARQVLSHIAAWSWLANALLPLFRLLPPFCLVDALLQVGARLGGRAAGGAGLGGTAPSTEATEKQKQPIRPLRVEV